MSKPFYVTTILPEILFYRNIDDIIIHLDISYPLNVKLKVLPCPLGSPYNHKRACNILLFSSIPVGPKPLDHLLLPVSTVLPDPLCRLTPVCSASKSNKERKKFIKQGRNKAKFVTSLFYLEIILSCFCTLIHEINNRLITNTTMIR